MNMEDLRKRLLKLPTAVISDVLGEMGLRNQVLAATIRPLDPKARIAGPAFCIRCERRAEPPPGGGAPKIAYEMDRRLYHGCIAVVDSGGFHDCALMGGNVGLSFKLRGCGGIVTDGGIRDAEEFAEAGLPVFCGFVTPLALKGRWHYAQIEVPVVLPAIGGSSVTVHPGDYVHADADGVVVIPRAHVEQVAGDAEVVENAEGRIKEGLKTGADREEVYRRNDRFSHIKRLQS